MGEIAHIKILVKKSKYKVLLYVYTMILIIRGHIRNSFDNKDLLNLVKSIHNIHNELKIYIHTWNIIANNISWRHIKENNTAVTEEMIYTYFEEVKNLIKHIIIDDDNDITLIGNTIGNINKGPMPLLGWKNYWYGKYKIVNYLFNENVDPEEVVINSRFDILNNSNSRDIRSIIQFIEQNSGCKFTKNIFMSNVERFGIDNIYMGNINTMYKLMREFYNSLDDILIKNDNTINQELLVFRVNDTLFLESNANL